MFACAFWLRVGMAAERDFNDLTWRLGTATRVDCSFDRRDSYLEVSKYTVSTVAVDSKCKVSMKVLIVLAVFECSREFNDLTDFNDSTSETLGVVVRNLRVTALLSVE